MTIYGILVHNIAHYTACNERLIMKIKQGLDIMVAVKSYNI